MPSTQHLEQLQSMQLLLLCAHGVGGASAGAIGPDHDASGVLQQLGKCWVQSTAARQLNSKSCRQEKCFNRNWHCDLPVSASSRQPRRWQSRLCTWSLKATKT